MIKTIARADWTGNDTGFCGKAPTKNGQKVNKHKKEQEGADVDVPDVSVACDGNGYVLCTRYMYCQKPYSLDGLIH